MAGLDMAGRGAAWGIYDIDNYLAHGGKLLDLRLFSEEQMAIIERLPWSDEQRARWLRFGNFLQRVGEGMGNARVRDALTEEEVRKIWDETPA